MAEEIIGEAWWQFRGDDSKLRAEVTKTENEIKQSATRGGTAFSGAMQAATGKVKGFFSDLGNVAKAFVAVFAAQQVVNFLGDAVAAAREETAGIAQLTTSLKTNSAAFDGNVEAIERVIEERMALGFADDEQRSSLAGLTAITKDHNKALELQRTAMDLARLRNIDLRTATDIMGKVYGGNIGILTRYGIQLGKGATATEALAAIQKMTAGQAEAWAQTEEGAAQTTGLAFGELTEDIGGLLLPAITELAKFTRDVLVPALRFLVDTIGFVLGPIGTLFDVIRGGIDIAGDAVTNFAMDFGDQGDKIHRLADRIGTDFDDIKDRVKQRMEETGESFDEAFAAIEESATTSMTQVHNAVAANMGGVLSSIQAGAVPIEDEYERIAKMPGSMMRAEYADIRAAAYQSQVEFAKGLLDAQNEPQVAMDALVQYQEETLSTSAQIARLMGMLHSEELAAGLIDSRPLVNAQAQATRAAIVNQLSNLGAFSWGWETGTSYAAGMNAAYGYVLDAAGNLAAAARGQVGIESEPKDPSSPLRGITKWGGNLVRTYVDDVLRHVPLARSAFASLAEAMAPPVAGLAGVAAQSFGGPGRLQAEATSGGVSAPLGALAGGETHLHAHLEVSGRPDVVETEEELARLFGRVVGVGLQPMAGGRVGG